MGMLDYKRELSELKPGQRPAHTLSRFGTTAAYVLGGPCPSCRQMKVCTDNVGNEWCEGRTSMPSRLTELGYATETCGWFRCAAGNQERQ